jgi:hypothetical protein
MVVGLGSFRLEHDGQSLVLHWESDGAWFGFLFVGFSLLIGVCGLTQLSPSDPGFWGFLLVCGLFASAGLYLTRMQQVTTTFDVSKREVSRESGHPNSQATTDVIPFADIKALKISIEDANDGGDFYEVSLVLMGGQRLMIARAPKRWSAQRDQDDCYLVVRKICAATGVSVQEPR